MGQIKDAEMEQWNQYTIKKDHIDQMTDDEVKDTINLKEYNDNL